MFDGLSFKDSEDDFKNIFIDPIDRIERKLGGNKRSASVLDREYIKYGAVLQREKAHKLTAYILLTGGLSNDAHQRCKRHKLDRYSPWKFVETWSDKLFKRQFRMSREEFFNLKDKCI